MKFDVYYPFTNKDGKVLPGIRPHSMEWSQVRQIMSSADVYEKIQKLRQSTDKEERASIKKTIPAVCFVGRCVSTRKRASMIPTQLVMVDIDHCKDPKGAWKLISEAMKKDVHGEIGGNSFLKNCLMVAHITCSGEGLRLVFSARPDLQTLQENMKWIYEYYHLESYGDFDTAVYDFSRLSFLSVSSDLLYENTWLYTNTEPDFGDSLQNPDYEVASNATHQGENSSLPQGNNPPKQKELFEDFTDEEKEKYENFEYRGTPVRIIVAKYMEQQGTPSEGEKHNFYNELVKNFRTITSNDKRALLYLLPRFGHSIEECWSQIKSICKVNTLSSIPKQFYFFLKDNGFYQRDDVKEGALKEYMMQEEQKDVEGAPYYPPIIREIVQTAPKDFRDSCINGLLPILGTLTSYARAKYPYDGRWHTTSFFSIIYAPPGTGKGFIEAFMELLFEDLRIRDLVQSERENVYLRAMNRRGDNDKKPNLPHTSLRIIPPKNSEAEFLEKQRDNHGYHMFTYAAEMDSWAKGVKAAGGNKDDMIRIAWDNGKYGQQFKSVATFKGEVNLYWNVLITGTLQQVESYFKNVENGLVTRCGFTSIDNQEFVEAPFWRELSKGSIKRIRDFCKRCDENTYETPCSISIDELSTIRDEDFDKEVDWRFKFKPRQTFDCSWIMPTIDAFHKRQLERAVLDVDRARDVFRRRVGVRGFRLALMCMCLFRKPRPMDLENCKKFIDWWMERDLESMLRLWGQKYNEQTDTAPKLVQRTVFNELPKEFSRNDVFVVCVKQGIKTPIRRIIFDWKKLGYIEEKSKDLFIKK